MSERTEAHRAKQRERDKRYYQRHRERLLVRNREKAKKYREDNPEKFKGQCRENWRKYEEAHPERVQASRELANAKRKALRPSDEEAREIHRQEMLKNLFDGIPRKSGEPRGAKTNLSEENVEGHTTEPTETIE